MHAHATQTSIHVTTHEESLNVHIHAQGRKANAGEAELSPLQRERTLAHTMCARLVHLYLMGLCIRLAGHPKHVRSNCCFGSWKLGVAARPLGHDHVIPDQSKFTVDILVMIKSLVVPDQVWVKGGIVVVALVGEALQRLCSYDRVPSTCLMPIRSCLMDHLAT